MTTPTIHLNGTPRERLIETLCDAGAAVNAAIEAVQQTAPIGRDYYPQGNAALTHATGEHVKRLVKLKEVYQELEELAIAINEA